MKIFTVVRLVVAVQRHVSTYGVTCTWTVLAQLDALSTILQTCHVATTSKYVSILEINVKIGQLRERERLQCFSQPTSLIAHRRRKRVKVSGVIGASLWPLAAWLLLQARSKQLQLTMVQLP